jgi:hypothetical protein
LLDLALCQHGRYLSEIKGVVTQFRPDVIAFSWRDMQIFSPQDLDGAMRDAFVFFHDPSILRKAAAALRGVADIAIYKSSITRNIGIIRKTALLFPSTQVALGGPSIRIFGDRLSGRLPQRVQVFPEPGLESFFQFLGIQPPSDLIEPDLSLELVQEVFPQWMSYRNEVIGVQTKLGCPQRCLYCLYGFLEGRALRRRDPLRVVKEIADYTRRWGSKRFWFVDAQLLSEPRDHDHLGTILDGMLAQGLDVQWSGYMRIHEIQPGLASLMVRSGLQELEVSLNSGAQPVLDALQLGFSVQQVMEGCRVLKNAGYAGRVFVNLSLNAPGETRETLLQTIATVRRIKEIFGDARVIPVVFFLAIQPHTGLESRALADHHLRADYNPLSVMPWDVLRLIYNPPPLGPLIGRACAIAFARGGQDVGENVLRMIESKLLKD